MTEGNHTCMSTSTDSGAPHQVAPEPVTATVPDPRARAEAASAELVLTRGPLTGTRIAARGRVTFGRARDCDIVLDDASISPHHAEIHHTGPDQAAADQTGSDPGPDHYTLVDVGSLNGVHVNRRPVAEQVQLTDGDEIWIGKARFTFHRRRTSGPRTC